MSRLVVKQNKPLHNLLWIVLIALSIAFGIWFLLDKSHWSYISSRLSGNQQMQKVWEENRRLESINSELADKVLHLERNAKIDKQVTKDLKNEFVRLQNEFYKLKGELEFYQGIMASTQDSKGLNVQGMRLETLGEKNAYRYRLILTNVTKNDRLATGVAKITLEGESGGKVVKYEISELAASSDARLEFEFKNFKRLEGNIMLPDGFNPLRITVELSSKDNRKKIIEKTFDWLSLIS